MLRGAVYLRSSKDRTDVSIEAQRQKLTELAATKSISIVAEFSDVVESGKDEDREGFQELTAAIKDRQRGWTWLLMLDTARLARNRFSAAWIKRDCERFGVQILFANMADIDPVTKILLESIFEGVDEWHSAISRQKAIAGMRVNVRKGWRAGGRAPTGYKLEYFPTGAVREGKPVLKSKLALSDDSRQIANFLKLRAHGMPRRRLKTDMGLPHSISTLITIEWNALVYAGHTVWNRHAEKKQRGTGQARRRPREEWVIEKSTHPALITEAEAERILRQLETSEIGAAISHGKSSVGEYLLSGVLEAPDGRKWTGAGSYYRLKASEAGPGHKVPREAFEREVLSQIAGHMQSDAFLADLAEAGRQSGLANDTTAPLREEMTKLEKEKARAAKLALETDDGGTFAALVADRSRRIAALKRDIEAQAANDTLGQWPRDLTPDALRELMKEVGSATSVLKAHVDRIVLNPDFTYEIRYRAWTSRCLKMASPRGLTSNRPPLDFNTDADAVLRSLEEWNEYLERLVPDRRMNPAPLDAHSIRHAG